MTKPREKTREELQAEIEDGKKKIRQLENREKIIKQKLSVEERKARNHRLCKRGGFMESLVPELIAMPDEDAQTFFRLALTSEPARARFCFSFFPTGKLAGPAIITEGTLASMAKPWFMFSASLRA